LLPIGPRILPEIYASHDALEPWSPRDFYESVFVPDRDSTSLRLPHIDQLNCQLYPFQQRAVRWLLRREGVDILGDKMVTYNPDQSQAKLPFGFIKTSDNGRASWFSPLLGIMTTDESLTRDIGLGIRGGILAEEMGLGKTVEIIALICLHRSTRAIQNVYPNSLPRCSATLIITPPSIIEQWNSELQTLAPHLRVMAYEGLRLEAEISDNEQLLARFLSQDVILTTYNILAREIHHSGYTADRDLRHNKRYQRRVSPLTQLTWWRVVLDEAQMIESGVSNAAQVAQLIPRENAWAVSGTPLRKDATGLLGLLIFLRCWPYCQSPQLWDRLITYHRDIFKDIFRSLALRHTKDIINDDIELPPQKRIVIIIPFTQIEEQHYSTLFQEMCDECGLEPSGRPLDGAWDSSSAKTIDKMRSWLARLRQTVLHPSIGARNRRALGQGKGPLRTVGEVLEVMREQNDTACRTDERALLMSQARRGQLLEHATRSKEALQIWLHTLEESKVIVEDCQSLLKSDIEGLEASKNASRVVQESEEEAVRAARSGVLRQKLRAAREIEHMCTFFVANAYYQIKTDKTITAPGSEAFQALQNLEESAYEKAQLIRKEMLVETRTKALSIMGVIREKARNKTHIQIPETVPLSGQGGIESRDITARLHGLLTIIDHQGAQLNEWREKIMKLLLLALVDEEEEIELQGDEYETSTKQQDEVYVYVDALRALIADRHDILTGQKNTRVEHEIKFALDQAEEGAGHSPQLLKELLSVRHALKPSSTSGSVRGMIAQLGELKNELRAQTHRGSSRASAELVIVDTILQNLHHVASVQTKAVNGLDRELELFRDAMNLRLEYYRQLQQISDTVAPYEEDLDNESLNAALLGMKDAETQIEVRIATLKSRARYLDHLRDEAANVNGQRLCTICQQQFETGILTSCGHSYCLECIRIWWKNSRYKNCPTCKKHLATNEFHQITYTSCIAKLSLLGIAVLTCSSYKPQEITMQEETQSKEREPDEERQSETSTIYSSIRSTTLNQIKNIDVDGSFGTKIDTLARHLFWIRENDPGAKSVIFSQFRDFLDILAKAFTQFKIGFTSIDRKDGIRKFKNDPSVRAHYTC